MTTQSHSSALTSSRPKECGGGELRDRFGFLRDLVAEMERRVPYAAALVSSTDGVNLSLRDGEQSASRRDPRSGIVLTVSNGSFLEEEATGDVSEHGVRQAAERLVERAATRGGRGGTLAIDPGEPLDTDFTTPVGVDPTSLSLADKLTRHEALRQKARGLDQRVIQATLSYSDSVESKLFVNRARFVTESLRRVRVFISLFVSDGSQRRYDWLSHGGTGGLELLDVTDVELEQLKDNAIALLSAKPVEPGTYDVVTDNGVTGVLAHEAFGHGVETDMFLKDRARGAHFIGERVGSDLVTIVDDPSIPGAYGSYFIDDEGQPASRTEIIRNGILQRGLSDLYSSALLGIPRSANGRRESFERKAYARMSNTFFAAGESSRQQVLESLDDGLYLCHASSGMEDPKGWGIQVSAHYAREYKGGKPTGVVVAPVAITGYVPDLLRDVSMVGNDFELHSGGCGKGWKEYVVVSDGGPHLRTRVRLG
ncbi:MAG: TldD protein, part of TldE/TldD proteolytic complex [uncultured Chloroflexi bacterium]|uniref:TldD protein, part of TldE/TldD proteolytic complex n=1 Tax=uncultured Chloroflexota bacterium TaxID=166587 RepID=A0A6J4I5Q4_9CHLR|nr:MAG: TldD protein, part of TldE/TldD proteolytic complex [uncultured Chloroflexota bacterium]